MKFRYTKHALVSLEERHIEKNMVEKTISSPDKVLREKRVKKLLKSCIIDRIKIFYFELFTSGEKILL